MSVTEVSATCRCGSLVNDVVLCPDHHRYFKQGKQLASVSSVIRDTWPIKPDFSAANPTVLEHARQRGILVDTLFCQYLEGDPLQIPVGTPMDAVDEGKLGFYEIVKWWESKPRGMVSTQMIVNDDAVAGTLDVFEISAVTTIWDLKCVSSPEQTYALQLGGYLDMSGFDAKHWDEEYPRPSQCGLIHCKFSQGGTVATVKPIMYDAQECVDDFRTLRNMWQVLKRRGGIKEREGK